MTSQTRFEARTWWVNRLVAHSIPSAMIGVGIVFIEINDAASVVFYFGFVAMLIILFEITSLNYTVVIEGDTLRYWSIPRFCSVPEVLHLTDISSAECVSYHGVQTASVVVKFFDEYKNPIAVHLASFRPADVRRILRWFDQSGTKAPNEWGRV